MKKIEFYAHTIQGRRKNNEDSCLAKQLDSHNILLAVADGMGGAAAGEIASQIAIEELQKHIKQHLEKLDDKADFKKILFEAYGKIQDAIKNQIEKTPEYQGMGTTLSVVWIYKTQYVWANLGDSRVYFLDDKIIKQITKDHTYVQDFMDKHGKDVPPEIAKQYGNYIMRSLDGGKDEPDIFPLNKPYEALSKNSAFLLCSDGLIPDKLEKIGTHLHQIYLSHKTLKTASNALVKFAYDKGSTDNITVVLGEYGKVKRTAGKRKTPTIILASIVGFIILALAVLVWQKPEIFTKKWNDFAKPKNFISQDVIPGDTGANDLEEKKVEQKSNPEFVPFKDLKDIEFFLEEPERLNFWPYSLSDSVKDYYLYFKNKNISPIKINSQPGGAQRNFFITKDLGLKDGNYEVTIMATTHSGRDTIIGQDFIKMKIIEE